MSRFRLKMVQDDGMTLEITVRGSAEKRYPAEQATVAVSAAVEGHDKKQVFHDAVAIQDPLTNQLAGLVERGVVTTWSSDQVRVYSHRPWGPDGNRLPLVHQANVQARAEFTDFERLSGFLDYWAGKDGVEIGGIVWDVTHKNRRSYEADVRRSAVDDAVAKAQSYADALRRGRVHAIQLADPGMLNNEPGQPRPMMAKAYMMDTAGGPQFELTPEEIVVLVEVDAKFVTD